MILESRIYSIFNKSLKHCWMLFLRYSACVFFLLLSKDFESTSWLNDCGNLIEGNLVNKLYINIKKYLA